MSSLTIGVFLYRKEDIQRGNINLDPQRIFGQTRNDIKDMDHINTAAVKMHHKVKQTHEKKPDIADINN